MKYDKLIENCRYLLKNSEEAERARYYLNSRVPKKQQELFGFGYFPDNESLNLLFSMMPEKELQDLELLYYKNGFGMTLRIERYSTFNNHNLIMPYRNVYGEIIGLVGRSLLNDRERSNEGIAKYKNTSFEKGKHLFGLFEAREEIIKKNEVYIVEGQIDVITSFCYGRKNTVGLGSSNMTFDQLALILRYTDNIILCLDNDEAGNVGKMRIREKYGKYCRLGDFNIPAGFKDIDDLLRYENGI